MAVIPFDVIGWGRWGLVSTGSDGGCQSWVGVVVGAPICQQSRHLHHAVAGGASVVASRGPACLPAFAGAVAVRGSATPSDDVALYPLRLHLLACCRCCGNSVGRRSWLVWWPVVLLLVWSKLV